MSKSTFYYIISLIISLSNLLASESFPSGKKTFSDLNININHPFVLSFGMAEAQASFQSLQNTANPEFIRTKLQELSSKENNSLTWLSNENRIWYVLRSLPSVVCLACGYTVDPENLNLIKDKKLISNILYDLITNINTTMLSMTLCQNCGCSNKLQELPKKYFILTDAHKNAIIKQINVLGINNQSGCKNNTLPNYRFSPELCNLLEKDSLNIDKNQLTLLAQFLTKIGNPMVFLHNYTNPLTIPNLFEKKEHIAWFANYCKEFAKACPNITHICPIVQPVAFAFRVGYSQNLPPFEIGIDFEQYLQNITQANIAACKQIKSVNPKIKTLISHQWKIMKPFHKFGDPRRLIELFVCKIANQKYNEKFVSLYRQHSQHFDGISLSLYPPVYFNLWNPHGNNCSGIIDVKSALQAIEETHAAFPDKDIYIGETSCNTFDPKKQKEFIDMTLYVCKISRDKGIPIKGVYFWSHANNAYSEWNNAPHSTNLAPFNELDEHNPSKSINAAGIYIQKILT